MMVKKAKCEHSPPPSHSRRASLGTLASRTSCFVEISSGYLLHGGWFAVIVPLLIYRSSLLRVAQYSAVGGMDPAPLFVLLFNCLLFVYIVH